MKTTEKPTLQTFHIEGVKHIAPEYAYEALINGNAVIIDVREEEEVEWEYIPLDNVLYHPLSKILDRLQHIPKKQNIILVCPGGIRSTKAANLLIQQGYSNVANLDGGLDAWESKKLPYKRYNAPKKTCGCSCSSTQSSNRCC